MSNSNAGPHTLSSYLTGYVIALVLTAIPFAFAWAGWFSVRTTLLVVALTAIIQVVVHLVYFLHINYRTTAKENLLALAFAGVLIFLMIGGTLWIMFDLHYQMM